MDDNLFLDNNAGDTETVYNEDGSYTLYHDLDNDGHPEIIQECSGSDIFGEPTQITTYQDTDADGTYETVRQTQTDEYGNIVAMGESHDYDQDGRVDMERVYFDADGDGQIDVVDTIRYNNDGSSVIATEEISYDFNGDQIADMTYNLEFVDATGDGQPDTVHVIITDEYGQQFAYEMTYDEYLYGGEDMEYTSTAMVANATDYGQYDPASSNPELVVGDPEGDMQYWEYQGQTARCAIYAQMFVIEEYLGHDVDIDELVALADANGWFDMDEDSGTAFLNMDKLLNYYGIENDMSFGNDISDIEKALNEGNNVIVSVDSGQIWYGDDNNIFSPFTAADHAVQVIGIDYSDPEHPMVILNDSGTPDGRGELVPLEVFENAWGAGDTQMIVCYA